MTNDTDDETEGYDNAPGQAIQVRVQADATELREALADAHDALLAFEDAMDRIEAAEVHTSIEQADDDEVERAAELVERRLTQKLQRLATR